MGWIAPFDAPLLLVLPDPQDRSTAEAMTQLVRIGWRQVEGHLDGGVEAWRASGGELRSYPTSGVDELCETFQHGAQPRVLDVRQPLEWEWGVVTGSERIFVGDLPARIPDLPNDRTTWVICSNGHRASIAASLLDRAEIPVRLISTEGVAEWLVRCRPAAADAR